MIGKCLICFLTYNNIPNTTDPAKAIKNALEPEPNAHKNMIIVSTSHIIFFFISLFPTHNIVVTGAINAANTPT